MRILACLALAAVTVVPTTTMASDISLVSGLYQKSKDKQDGESNGDSSTIEVGGRYGEMFESKLGWFAQALTAMRSYDAPSGVKSPSDSMSLSLGGGVRYIGKRWNEAAVPFLWALGEYKSEKTAVFAGNGYNETEVSGLFYSAGLGLRLAIDTQIFVDLENPLFESALFATEKTEGPVTTTQTAPGGPTVETRSSSEKTRNELYFKTYAPFSQLVVSLGYKF